MYIHLNVRKQMINVKLYVSLRNTWSYLNVSKNLINNE